jgi:nitroimidazol reductase NimA-like FMN-containing flavoprotein (pyridoxamine 5'-phosphate oxidase superfamily)
MTDEHIKTRIKEFLKNNQLTVIATVDEENNKPEAAVIAFAEKNDLSLVFGTSNKSRKYKNIQRNPNVSFVIGWSHEGTIQYEGIAREISEAEAGECAEILALKNKQTEKFKTNPDQRYFLVQPRWIRLLDHHPTTGGVFEIII